MDLERRYDELLDGIEELESLVERVMKSLSGPITSPGIAARIGEEQREPEADKVEAGKISADSGVQEH